MSEGPLHSEGPLQSEGPPQSEGPLQSEYHPQSEGPPQSDGPTQSDIQKKKEATVIIQRLVAFKKASNPNFLDIKINKLLIN